MKWFTMCKVFCSMRWRRHNFCFSSQSCSGERQIETSPTPVWEMGTPAAEEAVIQWVGHDKARDRASVWTDSGLERWCHQVTGPTLCVLMPGYRLQWIYHCNNDIATMMQHCKDSPESQKGHKRLWWGLALFWELLLMSYAGARIRWCKCGK